MVTSICCRFVRNDTLGFGKLFLFLFLFVFLILVHILILSLILILGLVSGDCSFKIKICKRVGKFFNYLLVESFFWIIFSSHGFLIFFIFLRIVFYFYLVHQFENRLKI
eukprot:Anaeramoba_flamelloidesa815646_25.p2 GENE.a815646_25~~a815646_25.p2  ORF type:complete len:109 (+),score=3.43 a815646_25:1297-1623(+)